VAFNSSTKKIVTKSLIKTIETKVSGKFTLDDDKIIDRVLDGCGCVNIQEEMVSGDFLQFKGSVNFTTMFTYGDKSLDSETIIVEFQEKPDE